MTQTIRKGAMRIDQVPSDILDQLNRGEIETANLIEGLAIDQAALLRHVFTSLDREAYIGPILSAISELASPTFNTLNHMIGRVVRSLIQQHSDEELWSILATHPSDIIRSWACYVLASEELEIDEYLEKVRPFALDQHFGVREISWLSMRSHIIENLDRSLALLAHWVMDDNAYARRFATESTRPRGVWCKHINRLKVEPTLAISLLEPLKADPSRYVQDSVSNWLNDASKTAPEFVVNLTQRWRAESPTCETEYIVRRALRTLNKKR
ncbi:MAG: DNA alkylation repair protein [Porphyromonadaceae bacterium]|nr:DNA alkylation repair protein [Porphyromonadaceae bacterium]